MPLRPDLDFILINANAVQLGYAPDRFTCLTADMHDMPIDDASVDAAMFCYSLCHGDIPLALREAARVVKRGGELFVYDYDRLQGDNELFRSRLMATAIPFPDMMQIAGSGGRTTVMHHNPEGDDQLFRDAYGNDEEYDQIFADLAPSVWKMRRI